MIRLDLPVSERKVRKLRAGDYVEVSGVVVTARDMAHRFLVQERPPEFRRLLKDRFIYHCGPVAVRENGGWRFLSAGPTTSIREEPYEADIIREYGARGVIGKGGMGERTLDCLADCGAVYLHAVGGTGALLAAAVRRVLGVHKLEEFGIPEAIWEIEVEGFKAVVTMDSHEKSLHKDVLERSRTRYRELMEYD